MSAADLALLLGDLVAAPSPSDGGELNSVTVSPGLPGFFATFVLAAAVVLLLVDMSRRTRRVQAQARVRERMEAEEQTRRDSATTDGAEAVEGGAPGADGPADGEPTDGTDGDPRPAADPEGPTPDDRR
ncbi:hypothetical protein [Brachybacterium sp. UNK5269]|uniref:hypothetical protein n=1 Tax=Brachybacterium sp. UNK5269 TaxID=3408576 RepID=UPI003BAFCE7B